MYRLYFALLAFDCVDVRQDGAVAVVAKDAETLFEEGQQALDLKTDAVQQKKVRVM